MQQDRPGATRPRELTLPASGVAEHRMRTSGALFEMRVFDWRELRQGSMVSQCPLIELTRSRARGGYVPDERHWQPLGEMRYFHQDRQFFGRWFDRSQRSLYCAIDFPTLTETEFALDDRRLPEACNIQNMFLRTLLARAGRELREPGFASVLVLESLSFSIAAEVLQHFATRRPERRCRGDRLSDGYAQRLAGRFRDGEVPAITDLAAELGLSTRHFARLFAAAAGEGIGAFCARHTILRSQDLLADPGLLVKTVAAACGFSGTTAFARAFQRAVGQTPQEYRRSRGVRPAGPG